MSRKESLRVEIGLELSIRHGWTVDEVRSLNHKVRRYTVAQLSDLRRQVFAGEIPPKP